LVSAASLISKLTLAHGDRPLHVERLLFALLGLGYNRRGWPGTDGDGSAGASTSRCFHLSTVSLAARAPSTNPWTPVAFVGIDSAIMIAGSETPCDIASDVV
jgi:hypothetical protein